MVFVLRFLCGAVVKHIRVLFRIRDDNWNSNAPLNSWFGVTVNEQELLVELNLENNNLEGSFPEVVTLCSSLKRLNLRGNKLTGPLPESIGRMTSLKDLGLSRNLLTGSIPDTLGRCSCLEYIGLSNNRLMDHIPESLGRCPNLREVSMGHNKLTGRIPETLGRCSNLTTLSLSDNRLSGQLPECVEKWKNLQKLLLDDNQINGPLPNSIEKCVNLRQLSIANNELSGFFPEGISKCVNLRRLNLSGNNISGMIAEGLACCKLIDHLYLGGNRLAGYEILRKLTRLKVLDLDLVNLLDLPPELKGKDVQVVLSYIREMFMAAAAPGSKDDDGGVVTVKRVKVILVGPGEAGKTTLVHRLMEGKFEGGFGMTDGVSMSDWMVDDLRLSLWDFSGQGVYMNTHSLFFSSRTVFMVVWNPRQHESEAMLYVYFHTVRNCAPDSPIILVSTHARDTSRMADGTIDSFEQRFGRKAGFGPIACYHHIDSHNGLGVQELKRDLVRVALDLPYVVQRIPRAYKKLELGLRDLVKHGRFSLTPNEMVRYAVDVHGVEEEGVGVATQLFHDWGAVHILPEGDIILEPQKLAQVMACAITYKAEVVYKMGDGKLGLLRHDEIDVIWKDYDASLRPQFLQMFHDYRLAYPLYDSHGTPLEASIVPAMLPEEPLGGGHMPSEQELRDLFFPVSTRVQASIRIEFEYLPVAMLPKLQVRLSALATLGGAWKYGCALQLESFCRASERTISQSYAIVRAQPSINSIDIYAGGDTTAARSVALRSLVALRNDQYKGLEFKDIRVFYNSEPLASRKLIERKLKRDSNAYIFYEGDNEDVAVPLRGLAFLFAPTDNEEGDDKHRDHKTRLIHDEMLAMHAARESGTSRHSGSHSLPLDVGVLPVVELLKKKKKKQVLIEGERKRRRKDEEWVDYRNILPQSLERLEQAALRAAAYPEEVDEFIDLERQLELCIPDILLFGCNIPSNLVEVHTIWLAYGDGSRVMALTPPEKPTRQWEGMPHCTLPFVPRDDRSTLPGINKRVSEILLNTLEVLGVECCPPQDISNPAYASDHSSSPFVATKVSRTPSTAIISQEFAPTVSWVGLFDMSGMVDAVRQAEAIHFQKAETAEARKVWVGKEVAERMHAPNMSVSDQVFRQLFKGVRGTNPHATLLRSAIDSITPISVGLSERFDVFLSHTCCGGPTGDIAVVEAIKEYLEGRGLVVWCDTKRKTGINKQMLAGIDHSSLFVPVVSKGYLDMVNNAGEDTCVLQWSYARRRKAVTRVIPVVIDEEVAAGWKEVCRQPLDVTPPTENVGDMDEDDGAREEEEKEARRKQREKAGWLGPIGNILAVQDPESRLVVTRSSLEAAKRDLETLTVKERRAAEQAARRRQKREAKEAKRRTKDQRDRERSKRVGTTSTNDQPIVVTDGEERLEAAEEEEPVAAIPFPPPGSEMLSMLSQVHSCLFSRIIEPVKAAASGNEGIMHSSGPYIAPAGACEGVTKLESLGVDDVLCVLKSLHMRIYCEEMERMEVTGLTLLHCDTPTELQQLGVRHIAKARELHHHIRVFRLTGVPTWMLAANSPTYHYTEDTMISSRVNNTTSRSLSIPEPIAERSSRSGSR